MISLKSFGRTGHESSRTIFGAVALGSVTQDDADRTLEVLLKFGVNHIDTAASYGDSELRLGPWMKQHRHDFFLATKTEKRTYHEAKEELHRSLDRLKVDYIDLWQMHFLVNPDEWNIALNTGGAIEAFIEAKEQGLTRFLGVTGHGLPAPTMHLRSLAKFDFDSVLLPYNYILMQNSQYAAEFNKLVTRCAERNVAIQTIKSIARGPLENKNGQYAVWYDPLDDTSAIEYAVKWVLGNSNIFLNTVGDIHLLVKVLEAANSFVSPPGNEIMQSYVQKYKITPLFKE
ncbi:aldo/keto reductase [candidate division KSB1 bacterium]|nr:aldo/keto reductase [candidate division KSB1 bacterium]